MPNRILKFAVDFDQTKRDLSVFFRLGCRNELALASDNTEMQRFVMEQYEAALSAFGVRQAGLDRDDQGCVSNVSLTTARVAELSRSNTL